MGRLDWGHISAATFYFLAAGVLAYLALSGLQGNYGLWALSDARESEWRLSDELVALEAREAEVANRVDRLSSRSLDLDLLDERARDILGMIRADELIVE